MLRDLGIAVAGCLIGMALWVTIGALVVELGVRHIEAH